MSSGRAAQIDDQTTRVGLTSASQTAHGGGGWHLLRVATARWNDTPPGAGGGRGRRSGPGPPARAGMRGGQPSEPVTGAGGGPAGDERPCGTRVGRGHGGRRAEGDR